MAASINVILSLLLVVSSSLAQDAKVPPQPPSMVQPGLLAYPPTYMIIGGDPLTLPCPTTGNPKPTVTWKKDGQPFTLLSINQDGSLTLPSTYPQDGAYQCFAVNSWGLAVSNVTQVITATQANFKNDPNVNVPQLSRQLGAMLVLKCSPTKQSIPAPRVTNDNAEIYWQDDKRGIKFPLSSRAQVDDNGNLNIAYLQPGDIGFWTCYIHNVLSKIYVGGSTQQIVTPFGTAVAPTAPVVMFYPNMTLNPSQANQPVTTTVVILEGRTASLRCFFGGSNGDITNDWTRTDSGQLPTDGRVVKVNGNVELLFTEVRASDAGTYACSGTNSMGTTSVVVNVVTQAPPIFQTINDAPHDVNASVGDNVVIKCNAYANPNTSITWFKNGIVMQTQSTAKYQFSQDLKQLTITNVCKNNCSGANDMYVIQCNATNINGYTFGNGYINVYERTVITQALPQQVYPQLPKPVTFSGAAISDPNTPVTYTWYCQNKNCPDDWCLITNSTDKYQIQDGTLTLTSTGEQDLGQYKLVASNGISNATSTVIFDRPPYHAEVWAYWWIPFIIILIFVIFVIVVLICCCCLYQNRGDEYPVDEKERQADRNPEKELQDIAFQDYQRPTTRQYYEDDQRQLLPKGMGTLTK